MSETRFSPLPPNTAPKQPGALRIEIDSRIGWLIIDHQARDNAISVSMIRAMPGILAELDANPDVRVIIMRGAGPRAFISGGDISEFEERQNSAEVERLVMDANNAMLAALEAVAKPMIAMIHGICFGGGLAVALYADLRIAADNARFCIPAARLGVGYPAVTVKSLIDRVGPAYTAEILYTARRYDAAEAWRMGLLNRVVPADALEDEVRATAQTIIENAPLTIRTAKSTIRALLQDESARDMAHVEAEIAACYASQDFREGQKAFMEKRRPVFRGI